MAAKLWEDIKKSATEAISYVSEKTEELTAVGKLKLEISSLRRKLEARFKDLGGLVYDRVEKGQAGALAEDDEIKKLVTEISTLEKQLRAKEEELRNVGKKETPKQSTEPDAVSSDQPETSSPPVA